MENKNLFSLILLALILVGIVASFASGQNEDDSGNSEIFGLELEKLIIMFNAWIATFLFVLSFIAYKRDGRRRLFFVSLAFFLFAVKSFMISSELYLPQVDWFDPAAVVLEFGVLLSFFYGVLKK
jgi:cell division protein FtsW (lipid II flippase)